MNETDSVVLGESDSELNLEESHYESEGADEGELEVKEPGQSVILEKADRSLAEFDRWYKSGRVIIDPDWQRSYVWDTKRASKLIESFLMDVPVPVIYLAKNKEGKYEVIDGVQRLTSVFKFFNNEFALYGVEMLPHLKGKKFKELSLQDQQKLEDTTLRTFELAAATSQDLLFIIFERLNTGGISLNEMEIRNCIYRGSLNDLIKDLSEFPEFIKSANQKDLSKRMTDRALVLRFLAFYEKHYSKAKNGMKAFLNDFMQDYRNPTKRKLNEFEEKFKHSMRAVFTVFGENAFRLRKVDKKGSGEWSTRVNASVFQVISVSFTEYDLGAITRRADAIFEEYLDMISNDLDWIRCVTRSTGNELEITYAFVSWQDRLNSVMSSEEPNDSVRIFSSKLKKEMYDQNKTCAICGQEVKSILDAALDHDIHYWRGGKTIPTNARLVHRLCNSKRSK